MTTQDPTTTTTVTAEQAGLNSLLSAENSVYAFAFVSSDEFYLGEREGE